MYLEEERKKALLMGLDTGEYNTDLSMDELYKLCETAGLFVVYDIVQKRDKPDKKTYIGTGKLEEAKRIIEDEGIDYVVFDDELSASQLNNLEEILNVAILDRTTVILDIFAGRATSKEGTIEVLLAQLKYRYARLAGAGKALSRLGGGIGTRGPGETKLESDRRHIRERIKSLSNKLKEAEEHRALLERGRAKKGMLTIALAGYTNVGKSSILNYYTDAGVLSKDMLFATLDPTARGLRLPSGQTAMLIDTVGFIGRLPHHLVRAFRSTLSHLYTADLILNVVDISSGFSLHQQHETEDVLKFLKIETPVLTVFNKSDLAAIQPTILAKDQIAVSAKTGYQMEELLIKIEELSGVFAVKTELLIPYSEGRFLEKVYKECEVLSEEYTEEGTLLSVIIEKKMLYLFRDFLKS